jgi:hypothetical protein
MSLSRRPAPARSFPSSHSRPSRQNLPPSLPLPRLSPCPCPSLPLSPSLPSSLSPSLPPFGRSLDTQNLRDSSVDGKERGGANPSAHPPLTCVHCMQGAQTLERDYSDSFESSGALVCLCVSLHAAHFARVHACYARTRTPTATPAQGCPRAGASGHAAGMCHATWVRSAWCTHTKDSACSGPPAWCVGHLSVTVLRSQEHSSQCMPAEEQVAGTWPRLRSPPAAAQPSVTCRTTSPHQLQDTVMTAGRSGRGEHME